MSDNPSAADPAAAQPWSDAAQPSNALTASRTRSEALAVRARGHLPPLQSTPRFTNN